MKYKIFLSAAVIALIAGCKNESDCGFADCGAGGGLPGVGGGQMVINKDNAAIALREAWFAANAAATVPFFVADTGIGDTSGGTAGAGNAAKIGAGPRIYVDPFGPTVYNCPVSGTFTVSGDVADQNTLTAGDTTTYDASSCDSGTGYTVNGTHQIDINSVSGDVPGGVFVVGSTFTFTGFQANTPTSVTSLNGDQTVEIDTMVANSIFTLFSGNSLTVDDDGVSIAISNYDGDAIISATLFVMEAGGTANSSVTTGSFDYLSTKTIQQRAGENAHDGVLDVYGSVGRARVIIIDATTVRVQVDENNSDNYEINADMSWDDFLNGTGIVAWSDTGFE